MKRWLRLFLNIGSVPPLSLPVIPGSAEPKGKGRDKKGGGGGRSGSGEGRKNGPKWLLKIRRFGGASHTGSPGVKFLGSWKTGRVSQNFSITFGKAPR